MADMSFLEGGSTELSTGKSATKIEYDEKKAHIEQRFSIPLETPYVKRAIENAEKLGFKVVPTLKDAIELRNDKQKVLSYREADVILRKKTSNADILWSAISIFSSFITEDDEKFTSGIYTLRARFNKGIEWMHTPAPGKTKEKLMEGADRLESIRLQIEDIGLPLHEEELGNGFHQEFLKPEHLAWRQYVLITQGTTARTISEKEEPSYKL